MAKLTFDTHVIALENKNAVMNDMLLLYRNFMFHSPI